MKRSDEQLKNLQSLKAQNYISSLNAEAFPYLCFIFINKVVNSSSSSSTVIEICHFTKRHIPKNKSINKIEVKSN